MRTCPACGKSTRAESTEPCTRCGFSPTDESGQPSRETIGTVEHGEGRDASGYRLPDPSQPAPTPAPTRRRRGIPAGAIWIVILFIWVAAQALGDSEGCSGAFDQKPGPTAQEAEDALSSDAAQVGLTGVEVECPDSAEDADVGESFDCTVTDPGSGDAVTVTVTNREDSFEWSRGPFGELLRERAQG